MGYSNGKEVSTQNSQHPDYQINMKLCADVIKNSLYKLPEGMTVSVRNGEGLHACIVVVTWNPCIGLKTESEGQRFANPVFLHQPHLAFKAEFRRVFNHLHALAKSFWGRHPIELSAYRKEYQDMLDRAESMENEGSDCAVPDDFLFQIKNKTISNFTG